MGPEVIQWKARVKKSRGTSTLTTYLFKGLSRENQQGSKIGSNDRYSFGDGLLGIFNFKGTLILDSAQNF
jgi:hypothetical protein